MKKAICHYSFHRTWEKEGWTADRLAQEIKNLGIEGIDFHVRYLGTPEEAGARIKSALEAHGLVLSGLSMSNNFNKESAEDLKAEVETVKTWLQVASEVAAPVSRIFGGHLPREQRAEETARQAGRQRILDGLGEVVAEAEKLGLVLALENHGGLPCTGEEQVDVIEAIGSPNLKATIDVGNYMQGGQEGHAGTRVVAKHCAYVHFKDNKKIPDASAPWGWTTESAVVGEGDVDLDACVKALKEAGYDGYVALEYEAEEDERTGVARSVETLNRVVR